MVLRAVVFRPPKKAYGDGREEPLKKCSSENNVEATFSSKLLWTLEHSALSKFIQSEHTI